MPAKKAVKKSVKAAKKVAAKAAKVIKKVEAKVAKKFTKAARPAKKAAKAPKPAAATGFAALAQEAIKLPIAHRVNELGGYGASGEVIYQGHPIACPSVLVDSANAAKLTVMSNGSVDFVAETNEGLEIKVLDGSFDNVEKRQVGVLSSNVWLALGKGGDRRVASLVNPNFHQNLPAAWIRLVKVGDPRRSMWFCSGYKVGGQSCQAALRYRMVTTAAGPALLRQVYVQNTGNTPLSVELWTWFLLHSTQRFIYNKPHWYDQGQPLSDTETVVSATVPYSEIVQIKRLSAAVAGFAPFAATCDYVSFVGDSSADAQLPQAVRRGRLIAGGAGAELNRFSTPTGAGNAYRASLKPGQWATVEQSLLYVTDPAARGRFRVTSSCPKPFYVDMASAFRAAAREIIAGTPGAAAAAQDAVAAAQATAPAFEVELPAQAAASNYANSVWMGVKELYENCRAQGSKLADGVELGTRDRAQDMWPKIKEDPGRVREDLVYALGFMYQTVDGPIPSEGRLSLRQKLHGMFPRQYPSRWLDRTQSVRNDNRPYTDSPLWLLNALDFYIRETGDWSILQERTTTVRLVEPDDPIHSAMIGNDRTVTVAQVVVEVLECFDRHVRDCPYGLTQVLYGDWCDPVDMFGTSVVGDPATRGQGRGGHVRLTAHLFECLVQMIDLAAVKPIGDWLESQGLFARLNALRDLAIRIRKSIVTVAWEDGGKAFPAAFVNILHELKADGSTPNYAAGETGYTMGSMKPREFDGLQRRELASQAYCLNMLTTRRDWLGELPEGADILRRMLETVDKVFSRDRLGLVMFTAPIANDEHSRKLVGRMGIVPSGTAENGEYHHCQVFMHRYRLTSPGQASTVWRQFGPIMSALRGVDLAGPFESPCTSYASDVNDPHFGKGMYFGLSGSVDWIVEIFQAIAGVSLNLHDPARPAVSVTPNLPEQLEGKMTYRRLIHAAKDGGGYDVIPLEVAIDRQGKGKTVKQWQVRINGQQAPRAEVASVEGLKELKIEIVGICA